MADADVVEFAEGLLNPQNDVADFVFSDPALHLPPHGQFVRQRQRDVLVLQFEIDVVEVLGDLVRAQADWVRAGLLRWADLMFFLR